MGKAHLEVALGVRAVENGVSVNFHELEDLLAVLKGDAEIPKAKLRQRKHMHAIPGAPVRCRISLGFWWSRRPGSWI